MNAVSARTLSPIKKRVPNAIEAVQQRTYDVSVKRQSGERPSVHRARERAMERRFRIYHLSVLRQIHAQHKPFYRFSRAGRTDRVFSANTSALMLPKDVRRTLFAGFHEIDLSSAHLCIAASLWDAAIARERLESAGYVIWDDLLKHLFPAIRDVYADDLYDAVKAACKIAVYSTVYGMGRHSIHGKLALRLCHVLDDRDAGTEAARLFMQHPVVSDLLDARDGELATIQTQGGAEAADGRFIPLPTEHGNPAASVLATVAQSYEQALMSVLVEYEQDRDADLSRNRFRVCLWLHDGAYVKMRHPRARMKDLNARLEARAEELGVIARFDHEEIQTND